MRDDKICIFKMDLLSRGRRRSNRRLYVYGKLFGVGLVFYLELVRKVSGVCFVLFFSGIFYGVVF